ncbi:major facilitator superfamily domain-containing protein [Glomus cerebriforme]|uniref:Lysosomal dipeptide transporter MFSD1 n=1 Tax=Glomus cerebriforme TaxID=658196 RepID=A0A397TIC9_9GLOM|nr:major facilitator superfamily domain-containing protein [Glomus cerebriforme]
MSSTEPLLSDSQRKTSLHSSPNASTYEAIPTRSSLSFELPEERRFSFGSEHEDNESNKISVEEETYYEEDRPWKYKMIALLCVLSLAVGSHYAAHTLGALKSVVKKELGISNSQYGVIQSSVSLVNTILPILGGVFIDTFGTSIGSILATSLIAIGNIFVALSTNLKSFVVMVIGRILYGIGSGTIITVQVAILSHWFKGKGLAIVVGIQIATSRMSSFLGNLTVVPIKEITGFYGWAFWFSAFLCVISLIINISYVLLMRILNERLSNQEMMNIKQKRHFSFKKLLLFPTIYWIFVLLEFQLGSAWTSFLHIHTELVKTRWNNTDEISDEYAAYNSSIAQFLPIFISPFLGYFLDRFGNRSLTLIMSTVFLTISMYLLGFIALTPIIVVIGMVCFSISLSLGPVGLLSSIPILLPLNYVGTALGIVKSSLNIGSTIYDILVGLLQDMDEDKYVMVMHLYLGSSVLSILVSILLYNVSKNWHNGILDMTEDERKENHDIIKIEESIQPTKRNYFYIIAFICTLIISWILFFIKFFND